MKANLKGMSGIRGLVLLHGEKIGIAAVGLLAALIIFGSLNRERLSGGYQPTDLQQKVQQTRATVEAADFDRAREEHPDHVPVHQNIQRTASAIVPADPYALSRGFDPPVITPMVPRTDPVLLAATEVLVYGGYGLFAFEDEEVQRQREEQRAREDERQQLEQARQLEQQQQQEQRGRQPRRGRGEEDFGRAGMDYMVDPRFPERRPVEAYTTSPAGLQLMGDERVDEATWACVVAKVPIRQQLRQYRDAFENARGGWDESVDFPEYAGFVVERAEVRPGQELRWERVPVHDAQASRKQVGPLMASGVLYGRPGPTGQLTGGLAEIIAKEWAGQPMEVVDQRYLDPNGILVYPLPPLVGREWGADATHPDIPLAIHAPPMEMEEELMAEEQPAAPPGEVDEGALFRATDGFQPGGRGGLPGRIGGMPGEMGGFPAMRRGGYPGGGHGEGFRGRMGGERGMYMGEGGYGGYGGMAGRGGTMGMLPRGVTHWLLRFFDFTVEPGKKYQYRVQLVLQDPNRNPNLPQNVLDSSVLNRIREATRAAGGKSPPRIRYADWSEPSPTVGIPLSGGVRVAEARAPRGRSFNEEPVVTLLVDAIDRVGGQPKQAAVEKELRRGFVANTDEDAEVLTVDGRFIDPVKSFKFRTGVTVLDVKGGEDVAGARDLRTPARVLLMDPSGELYVRSELDDLPEVERHRMIFAKTDPRRRGRGMPGEEGMYPPPYGGEGGFRGRGP